jgi:hypothetical protein
MIISAKCVAHTTRSKNERVRRAARNGDRQWPSCTLLLRFGREVLDPCGLHARLAITCPIEPTVNRTNLHKHVESQGEVEKPPHTSRTKSKLSVATSTPRKHFSVCSDYDRMCSTTRYRNCPSANHPRNSSWHCDSFIQLWVTKPHPTLVFGVVTPRPSFAFGCHSNCVSKSTRNINHLRESLTQGYQPEQQHVCLTATLTAGSVPDVRADHPRILDTRECPFHHDPSSQGPHRPKQTASQSRSRQSKHAPCKERSCGSSAAAVSN